MYTIATVVFCLVIAIFDLKTYRIPDILLIAFVLVIIIVEKKQPFATIETQIMTALVVFLLFGFIWHFSQGMGFGDVKYATVLGYILGYNKIIPALIVTAFLCVFVYIIGILLFHWSKTTKIPFAPFLSVGAILTVIGGPI